MSLSIFMVAFFASLTAYAVVSGWQDRRLRAATLRRFSGKDRVLAAVRRSAQPVLMQISDAVRGRFATKILERLRLKQGAEELLETAALKWGAAGLMHRSIGAFLAVFALATLLTQNRQTVLAVAAGGLAAVAPFLYVKRKAGKRVRMFEEQFPDCLEFISRSMRAGHAFSVSLEMVYREFSEPLAGEFRRTFEEQNLGQPLEIVLKKLSRRIPSMDVQFFVSAVLLQKRTGGNLAELLDKLAHIIRERFKLRARIRAISAQGLMSGRILALIPVGVAALMFMVNPDYARFFVVDPIGHQLLGAAVGLLVIGYLIIRKIVTIEV
jgi:tight adherence protein B